MSTTSESLAQRLRRLGSDFSAHPVSRGVDDCEEAGAAMLDAAHALAALTPQAPAEDDEDAVWAELDALHKVQPDAAEPVPAPVQPTDEQIAAAWKAWPRTGITSAARAIEFVWHVLATPPVESVERDATRWLTEQDRTDLERVEELFSDGEGWDLPKARMQRLAELGVIRRTGGNYYAITSFGMHCLDRDWPLPLRTAEEYNEWSRQQSAALAADKEKQP